MKPLTLFCVFLIAYGLSIYACQAVEHYRANLNGRLIPFDEDGERIFLPALGTICVGSGLFLLVLSSGRRK